MKTVKQILNGRRFINPDEAIAAILEYDGGVKPEHGRYSFSTMNGCLLKFYNSKVNKQTKIRPRRFGTDEGSAVHECFDLIGQSYMSSKQPDPAAVARTIAAKHPEWGPMEDTLEERCVTYMDRFDFDVNSVVGVEQKLGVRFDGTPTGCDDPDAWFVGKVDYLGLDSDRMLHMIDYKNYPSIHSNDALANTREGVGAQLMGYSVLARAWFGRENIRGAYRKVYYSRFGVTRSVREKSSDGWSDKIDTHDELDAFWGKLRRRMLTLELLQAEAFVPQPASGDCQYCDFVHICPAIQAGEPVIRTQAEAEALAGEMVVLNERMTRGKTLLKQWASERAPIKTAGASVSYEVVESETYDVEEMIKRLRVQWGAEFWDKFISQATITAASKRDLYASLENNKGVLEVETKTKLKTKF